MSRPASVRQSVPGLVRIVRSLWPWIRTERPLIVTSSAALLAGVVLRLAEPWPLKLILDRVIRVHGSSGNAADAVSGLEPMALVILCAIAVVVITGLRGTSDYVQKVGFAKVGNRVLKRIREHVYGHVQRLSLAFHGKARSGDLIVRVTRDVSLLRDVTSTALLPLAANVLALLGMVAVMFVLQWRLALLAVATVPLFWLSTAKINRGIHLAARRQRQREGAMASTAAESIGAIGVVQALSLESVFAGDFADRNAQSQKQDMKAARLSAKLGRNVDILLAVATALVMGFGASLVLRAAMTPGDLIVFLAYLRRAFKPAKDFAKFSARLAKATAAGERVLALLDLEPDIRDLPGATVAPRFVGAVRFDSVDFSYEPCSPVLTGVDFNVAPGQTVALVGPSGIGKSTVASLLSRLYDPSAGRVMIDGRDIREYTLQSLRSQIGVVLQDTVLFAGSIGENIALGADATPQEIEAAARLANVHDFIAALPAGYDTVVGERGSTLSLGQRQRIAIARAIVRGTPIVVLDEPTTGLDGDNERAVIAALEKLVRGRTTLLITHDVEFAARADLVLYLEDGRLREHGAPRALLAAGGRFADLHRLQTATGASRG